MTRRGAWLVAVGLAAAAGGWAVYRLNHAPAAATFTTAAVVRGDLVETVEATGKLQAVTTVQVGTQVSGTIKALHADFNSKVRRGQVVAELEPSLFETQVEQARASLTRLQADVHSAEVQGSNTQHQLARAKELAGRALIAATDLEAAEVAAHVAAAGLEAARAQVVQAQASLHQSEVNLAHTIITAPIDGIVISRNVDVGQTVAASMQAPTLFVIAQDLRAMQVEASIAEADIGRIEIGQPVTFRVDAYPADTFHGTVSQVRLQPVVEQNVVSYVTVIRVPNTDLRLKPGMTANVTVEIARAADALLVPNAALRIHASAQTPSLPRPQGLGEDALPRGGSNTEATEIRILEQGQIRRVPVRTGITDGRRTVVFSDALTEGAQAITSISSPAQAAPASTSPLLPAFRGRGAGAGGSTRPQGR